VYSTQRKLRAWNRALRHTDRPQPRGALEAKFSVQYCIARALLHGKVILEYFDGETYAEPAVQSLLQKVQASPYTGKYFDDDDRFDAELKVRLTDGRVLEAKVDRPLGRTADHPIAQEDLNAKFADCATRALAPDVADAVCRQVWALESLRSVRELTSRLEAANTEKSKGERLEVALP
jgi:2-methylcitrate dehydratase PrpD